MIEGPVPIAASLAESGISLPPLLEPTGRYRNTVVQEGIVYVSGHAAVEDGAPDNPRWFAGTIGDDIDVDRARGIARIATLHCLASLHAAIGSLDRVHRILKVVGMLRTTPGFGAHPHVMDACSDLLIEVFGERGRAARSSVGMVSLPFGTPVEIEMIVAIEDR